MSKRFYQLASLILLISLILTGSNHTIYYDDYLQSTKLENSRTFTLLIDASFTEQEKNIIIRAGHRWEKVTNNFISFIFKEQKDRTKYQPILDFQDYSTDNNFINLNEKTRIINIWRTYPEDVQLQHIEKITGVSLMGFAPGKSILLVPARTDSIEEFESVAAHEIGHVIGLKHTKSLMNAIDSGNCITSIDVQQFCQIYNCNKIKIEAESCSE